MVLFGYPLDEVSYFTALCLFIAVACWLAGKAARYVLSNE
ncbi:protein of unknown function (plasmid) [Rhodovastum atsumiense]|nr:protein of unknown function [Rhodovastum atsumiense]